jgi:competence protein ComEC
MVSITLPTPRPNSVHPLLPYLLAYSFGVFCAYFFDVTLSPFVWLSLFFSGAMLLIAGSCRSSRIFLLILAAVVGVARTQYVRQVSFPPDPVFMQSATVISHPTRVDKGWSSIVRLPPSSKKARLFFLGEKSPRLGETIQFRAKLNAPRNFGNEWEFNQELYSQARGIDFQGTVIHSTDWWVESPASKMALWLGQYRRHAMERAEDFLDPSVFPLFTSFVLGEKGSVDRVTEEAFRRSGVMHILVVSGFHIGVIAAVFGWLAGFLFSRSAWLMQRIPIWHFRAAGALLGTSFFCLLTPFQIPVARAFVGFLIALVALRLRRAAELGSLLVVTLFGLLVVQPLFLFDVSSQLSFAAVAGVGIGLTVVRARIQKPNWFWTLLWVTLGALSATLPITVASFHSFSLYCILGNLIFCPILGTGAMLVALAALLFGGPLFPIGNYLFCCFEQILIYVLPLMKSIAAFSFSDLYIAPPGFVSLAGYLGLLTLLALAPKRRVLLSLLFVSLIAFPYWANERPTTEVNFLHVGQGDAIVLQSTEGETVLIDAGPGGNHSFDAGKLVIHPWLKAHGIRSIDLLILTHFDMDHVGGTFTLLDEINVHQIWVPKKDRRNVYWPLRLRATELQIKWREVDAALPEVQLGRIRLKVIHPSRHFHTDVHPENNNSLVVQARLDGRRFLFTGDIEEEGESHLIQERNFEPTDVLKIAHHGSKSSTGIRFLQTASPIHAIISSGFQNRFHHPSEQTLSRLVKAHVQTWRGDECGEIDFKNHEDRSQIFTVKKRVYPLYY